MLKRFWICAAWVLCLALSAMGAAEEADAAAITVRFEHIYGDNFEYAVITAEDASGNELWSRTTGRYEAAQLDWVNELAANGDAYYYVENGAIVALQLSDGTELWRNEEFCGSAYGYAFGDDGTLYACGYFGPDFFAVDAQGNTLARIEMLQEDMYWPYKMEYLGDRVAITFENGGTPDVEGVLYVNLEDYTSSAE